MNSPPYFLRSKRVYLANMGDNDRSVSESESHSTHTTGAIQSQDTTPTAQYLHLSASAVLPPTSLPSSPVSNPSSQTLSQSCMAPTVIIQNNPNLKFDPDNVDIFFHTFEAHYFNRQLSDEALYFELIKCLSPDQFHKVSLGLHQTCHSFRDLKALLINAYTIPLHLKSEYLRKSPGMGDRTPTELLGSLKRSMGNYNPIDRNITWFLKSEFMTRLPPSVQSILAAFQNNSLKELAKIADSVMRSASGHSSRSDHDAMSILLQEVNALRLEVSALRNSSSSSIASTTVSHPHSSSSAFAPVPAPRSHTFLQPPALHFSFPGRRELYNGLCYYHHKYASNARHCVPGCRSFSTFKKPLNFQGGAST